MTALLQSMLEQELATEERVLWSGQPDPLQSARTGIAAAVPGGMALAMGIAWFSVLLPHLPDAASCEFPEAILLIAFQAVFLLPGAIITLAGLGLLLVPVWIWRRARASLYVVSSRRCVILNASWPRSANGYPHSRLVRIERVDHAPGRGDLVITIREEPGVSFRWNGPGDLLRRVALPMNRTGHRLVFRGIRDAGEVEKLLMELRKERSELV